MACLGFSYADDKIIDNHFRFCDDLHGWENTPNIRCGSRTGESPIEAPD